MFGVTLRRASRFYRALVNLQQRTHSQLLRQGGNVPSANMCLSDRARSVAQPEEPQCVTKLIERRLRLSLRSHRALLKHAKYVTGIAR
jgi:hypothetical protein